MSNSLVTQRTIAHQAPLSVGFPRQEYWSGLSFPPPGDLPKPGTEPKSPALADGFFTTELPVKQYCWCSVQFSRSVMSYSLWPHESQHARPPCPSPSPTDSGPLSPWYHPAISSSVVPFSSCPQSLPASESFPMGQLLASGGQVLELQLQHHFFQRNPRADLLHNGLVGSPCSRRDSQESSPTPQFKCINSSALSLLHSPTLTSIHDHWKTTALTRRTLVSKVMSLLSNILSRLVITFLLRSKCLLISWLQSPSAVILRWV